MSGRTDQTSRFLRPETVSRLSGMDLRARLIVEGFIAGLHRSPYHGFSVEFAEYRQYNAGESTRNIDWKIYAKTDRHYTKIFEDETNLRGTLMLDRSASMDVSSGGVTKLVYGALLCAALAFLMIKQRDAAGLALFDERLVELLPHRSTRAHLFQILQALETVEPGTRTRIAPALHETAERITRRGMIVLVSDLMDDPDEVIGALRHFRHRGHEIVVFHLLDPLELSLDVGGEVTFVDRETGERLRTQPWFVRSDYRRGVRDWTRLLGERCAENAVDYNLVVTDVPFDLALTTYLEKRSRMR